MSRLFEIFGSHYGGMDEIDSHRLAKPVTKMQALLPPLFICMEDFILLKRTYPISTSDRECDAYKYLIENTTEKERSEWGVKSETLKKIIKEGEKYIYQVGKENGQFRVFSSCFENYAIIRKFIYGIADDI